MSELFSGAGPLLQELQLYCRNYKFADGRMSTRWHWGHCLLTKNFLVVMTAAGSDSCWEATTTIDQGNEAHHL
jgi:hypothetical protein